MSTLNQTMKLFGGGILKRSCGLTRKLSSSSILQSKIVDSEVMDLQLPNLSFHEMCWSREGKWGDRAALVSCEFLFKLHPFSQLDILRLTQSEGTSTPCQKPMLYPDPLVMVWSIWVRRERMWWQWFCLTCQSMPLLCLEHQRLHWESQL